MAAVLGDLAVGVVQAAGYLAEAGMPADEYIDLLTARAGEILDQGRPLSHPQSLAAVTQLAFDRLRAGNPAAAEFTGICALLAADPVPADWFPSAARHLPAPLADMVTDPVVWRQVLARIGRSVLARVDRDGLAMHRLTQGHRAWPPRAGAGGRRPHRGGGGPCRHPPGSPSDTRIWPGRARVLPHLLSV